MAYPLVFLGSPNGTRTSATGLKKPTGFFACELKHWLCLLFQHFDYMLCQIFIDLIMARNGLRYFCLWILIPIVIASMTYQNASNLL